MDRSRFAFAPWCLSFFLWLSLMPYQSFVHASSGSGLAESRIVPSRFTCQSNKLVAHVPWDPSSDGSVRLWKVETQADLMTSVWKKKQMSDLEDHLRSIELPWLSKENEDIEAMVQRPLEWAAQIVQPLRHALTEAHRINDRWTDNVRTDNVQRRASSGPLPPDNEMSSDQEIFRMVAQLIERIDPQLKEIDPGDRGALREAQKRVNSYIAGRIFQNMAEFRRIIEGLRRLEKDDERGQCCAALSDLFSEEPLTNQAISKRLKFYETWGSDFVTVLDENSRGLRKLSRNLDRSVRKAYKASIKLFRDDLYVREAKDFIKRALQLVASRESRESRTYLETILDQVEHRNNPLFQDPEPSATQWKQHADLRISIHTADKWLAIMDEGHPDLDSGESYDAQRQLRRRKAELAYDLSHVEEKLSAGFCKKISTITFTRPQSTRAQAAFVRDLEKWSMEADLWSLLLDKDAIPCLEPWQARLKMLKQWLNPDLQPVSLLEGKGLDRSPLYMLSATDEIPRLQKDDPKSEWVPLTVTDPFLGIEISVGFPYIKGNLPYSSADADIRQCMPLSGLAVSDWDSSSVSRERAALRGAVDLRETAASYPLTGAARSSSMAMISKNPARDTLSPCCQEEKPLWTAIEEEKEPSSPKTDDGPVSPSVEEIELVLDNAYSCDAAPFFETNIVFHRIPSIEKQDVSHDTSWRATLAFRSTPPADTDVLLDGMVGAFNDARDYFEELCSYQVESCCARDDIAAWVNQGRLISEKLEGWIIYGSTFNDADGRVLQVVKHLELLREDLLTGLAEHASTFGRQALSLCQAQAQKVADVRETRRCPKEATVFFSETAAINRSYSALHCGDELITWFEAQSFPAEQVSSLALTWDAVTERGQDRPRARIQQARRGTRGEKVFSGCIKKEIRKFDRLASKFAPETFFGAKKNQSFSSISSSSTGTSPESTATALSQHIVRMNSYLWYAIELSRWAGRAANDRDALCDEDLWAPVLGLFQRLVDKFEAVYMLPLEQETERTTCLKNYRQAGKSWKKWIVPFVEAAKGLSCITTQPLWSRLAARSESLQDFRCPFIPSGEEKSSHLGDSYVGEGESSSDGSMSVRLEVNPYFYTPALSFTGNVSVKDKNLKGLPWVRDIVLAKGQIKLHESVEAIPCIAGNLWEEDVFREAPAITVIPRS